MSSARLAAIELRDANSWLETCPTAIADAGLQIVRRGSEFVGWDPGRLARVAPRLKFAEGFGIRRLWLGPRRHALAVRPRRLYFEPESNKPSGATERDILGTMKPPPSRPDIEQARGALDVLESIRRTAPAMVGDWIHLQNVRQGLDTECRVSIGNQTWMPTEESLNLLYRQNGFDTVPPGFGVWVVPVSEATKKHADAVVSKLQATLQARNLEPRAGQLRLGGVMSRLAELDRGGTPRDSTSQVLLLVLPERSKALPEETQDLMAGLDRHHLAWRRCYADDPLEFSVPDQLASILQAAGGRPHRIVLQQDLPRIWSLGVDLSHPEGSAASTLCVALVDPEGALAGAWRTHQRRNEAVSPLKLRALLHAAAKAIRQHEAGAGALLVRDGRLFEKENHRFYREELGIDVSLVECRKGGNPQLLLMKDGAPELPRSAVWGEVRDCESGFLVTHPQRDKKTLDHVLKLSWRKSWDTLDLGSETIARVMAALCFAPGLGLRRRTLPAPLYWADGIAGANDSDLRFRGQQVSDVD